VQDPRSLFTTSARPDLGRPVLIQALDGFADAGSGRRLAREHLLNALDSELLRHCLLHLSLRRADRSPHVPWRYGQLPIACAWVISNDFGGTRSSPSGLFK